MALIEKGRNAGSHLLSGAIMRPSAMRGAVPRGRAARSGRAYGEGPTRTTVYFMTKRRKVRLRSRRRRRSATTATTSSPIAQLGRWLAEKAEEAGVYVLAGDRRRRSLLVEDGRRPRRAHRRQGPRSGGRGAARTSSPARRSPRAPPCSPRARRATWPARPSATSTSAPTTRRSGSSGSRRCGRSRKRARPGHPHARLAAALRRQVPRVRRLVDLPDGRGQGLDRLRGRARLPRRHLLGPRRAPGVQDPPVHPQDARGRQAGRPGGRRRSPRAATGRCPSGCGRRASRSPATRPRWSTCRSSRASTTRCTPASTPPRRSSTRSSAAIDRGPLGLRRARVAAA